MRGGCEKKARQRIRSEIFGERRNGFRRSFGTLPPHLEAFETTGCLDELEAFCMETYVGTPAMVADLREANDMAAAGVLRFEQLDGKEPT